MPPHQTPSRGLSSLVCYALRHGWRAHRTVAEKRRTSGACFLGPIFLLLAATLTMLAFDVAALDDAAAAKIAEHMTSLRRLDALGARRLSAVGKAALQVALPHSLDSTDRGRNEGRPASPIVGAVLVKEATCR